MRRHRLGVASMSLLTTTFPEGPMRNRAFSVYTVFGASGFSLGLVLSGLLTEISWRWTQGQHGSVARSR